MQGQPMKKNDEKERPPKNSTKERFPITLQVLNSHDRDPRRLNNHQNLPNKHQTQQIKKTRMMYVIVKKKPHIYTL
jgi:hypothetical protein